MFDHRLAADVSESLAGKARRLVTSGDDGDSGDENRFGQEARSWKPGARQILPQLHVTACACAVICRANRSRIVLRSSRDRNRSLTKHMSPHARRRTSVAGRFWPRGSRRQPVCVRPSIPPVPSRSPEAQQLDALTSGVQSQALRLRQRLAVAPAPHPTVRNPFRIWRFSHHRRDATERRSIRRCAVTTCRPSQILCSSGWRRTDSTRTAMIESGDELVMASEGQTVVGRYRVAKVSRRCSRIGRSRDRHYAAPVPKVTSFTSLIAGSPIAVRRWRRRSACLRPAADRG